MPEQSLQDLITNHPIMNPGDKSYLLEKIKDMNAIDRLKLKHSVQTGKMPEILKSIYDLRKEFAQKETPPKPQSNDVISAIATSIAPPKPKKPVSTSFMAQPYLLGSPAPHALMNAPIPPLFKLGEIASPLQLCLLNPSHVSFGLEENADQIIGDFLERLTTMFDKITEISLKRNYFMNFLQSPLFGAYMNTGLTALKHPELEPASVVLNTLSQIHPRYINKKQFEYTAKISNHLRNIIGI